MTLIKADDRSRVGLSGRPRKRFLLQESSDDSILPFPAVVISEAHSEYDHNSELQELLLRAAGSATVHTWRRRAT